MLYTRLAKGLSGKKSVSSLVWQRGKKKKEKKNDEEIEKRLRRANRIK